MGADRTLMQVKVRCGLGRVGVLGRLYGNSCGMSAPDQSPHFDRSPLTSGLPPRKRTSSEQAVMSQRCQQTTLDTTLEIKEATN
jgi:hypothetical protein